jgi:pilus assembly protein CpaF
VIKTLKGKVRERLVNKVFSLENATTEEYRKAVHQELDAVIHSEHLNLPLEEKNRIINEMTDELSGFGPIENLMKDRSVTEIMIVGAKKVYIERSGKKELSAIVFEDEQHLMQLVYKLLAPTRRRVDESFPYTEIALKDGSRINIIISPLSLEGPVITIRKFLKELKSIDDLINLGSLDRRMGEFLIACIKAKINIVFSGATGAGKTTTLNVLSSYIPNEDRVITIEDTAELRLNQDHVVRLESRRPNIEGKGEVLIGELFRNSLRMRPDRIIIGEIRGAEALDMLQAICSGHKGSLAVLHANSPQDVIYRLETMILTSGVSLTIEAIHRQIATAIEIIVQQEQFPDGSRKITHIAQVNGLDHSQAVVENIFVFDMEGADDQRIIKGKWHATGIVPKCLSKLAKFGIDLPAGIFNKD